MSLSKVPGRDSVSFTDLWQFRSEYEVSKSEKGAVGEMASREEILADFQVCENGQIQLLILLSGILSGRQI